MIVKAPEYDSSNWSSSANITNIENEPPNKYRWQMTKKEVELVTHPRGFLQKKASSILSEISDGAAASHTVCNMERISHQKGYGARGIFKTYNKMPC